MRVRGCLKMLILIPGGIILAFIIFMIGMAIFVDSDPKDPLEDLSSDSLTSSGSGFKEEKPFDPSGIEPSPQVSPAGLSAVERSSGGPDAAGREGGLPALTEGKNTDPSVPPDPFAYPGSARPQGVSTGAELFSTSYEPSEERQGYRHPEGVIIGLPPMASPVPAALSVKELEIGSVPDNQFFPGTEGRQLLGAYDITLGDIHRFDEFVTVTLPYPEGYSFQNSPAEQLERELSAVTFNRTTGRWQPEPASFDEDGITMYLDHLTAAGVTKGGPQLSNGLMDIAAGSDTDSWDKAVEAGWASFTGKLGIAGTAGSFAGLVSELPFLKGVNQSLGYLGSVTTLMDIAGSISDGKTAEANLSAAKAVLSWAMGKVATLGMQVASLGTFFIDYSLTAFAEGVLSSQEKAIFNAYRAYYDNEGWSTATWYTHVKAAMYGAESPEQASASLKTLIENYTKKIWKDEGAFVGYLADERGHGWAGDAGLTDEMKAKLEQAYMRELAQTLEPVFLRARSHLRTKLFTERYRRQIQTEVFLELPALVWIDVVGLKRGEEAQVALFKDGSPYMRARPSEVRADFYAALPMKRLLQKDIPDTVKIRVKLIDSGQEIVKVYSKPIVFHRKVLDVRLDIDEVYERASAEDPADPADDPADAAGTTGEQPAADPGPDTGADFDDGADSGSSDGEDVISIDPDNLPTPDSSDPSGTSDTAVFGSRLDKLLQDYRNLKSRLAQAMRGGLVDEVRDLRIMLEGYEEAILEAGGTQAQVDAINRQFESTGSRGSSSSQKGVTPSSDVSSSDVSTGDQGSSAGSMSSEDFHKLERQFEVTYKQY